MSGEKEKGKAGWGRLALCAWRYGWARKALEAGSGETLFLTMAVASFALSLALLGIFGDKSPVSSFLISIVGIAPASTRAAQLSAPLSCASVMAWVGLMAQARWVWAAAFRAPSALALAKLDQNSWVERAIEPYALLALWEVNAGALKALRARLIESLAGPNGSARQSVVLSFAASAIILSLLDMGLCLVSLALPSLALFFAILIKTPQISWLSAMSWIVLMWLAPMARMTRIRLSQVKTRNKALGLDASSLSWRRIAWSARDALAARARKAWAARALIANHLIAEGERSGALSEAELKELGALIKRPTAPRAPSRRL